MSLVTFWRVAMKKFTIFFISVEKYKFWDQESKSTTFRIKWQKPTTMLSLKNIQKENWMKWETEYIKANFSKFLIFLHQTILYSPLWTRRVGIIVIQHKLSLNSEFNPEFLIYRRCSHSLQVRLLSNFTNK